MTPLTLEGNPRPGSTVLHAGCGGDVLPPWLAGYVETRLDIDPGCRPNIVADMRDLGDIGPFDMVWSSHALEHLDPNSALEALREFRRVLSEGGLAVVVVPDLEGVPNDETIMYESDNAGPIAGADMHQGLRRVLADMPHMAHRSGFVAETLRGAMERAGFAKVWVKRIPGFNLLGVGLK